MFSGNPSVFAIEFEIEQVDCQWIFGRICYVVLGCRLGTYSPGSALNSAEAAFEDLLRFRGLRIDERLMGLPAGEAYREIDDALYRDRGQSDDQVARDKEMYWRFHAFHPGLDSFDSVKCYLVENAVNARFLWLANEGNLPAVREAHLTSGEFDNVLAEFVNDLRSRTN